MIDREGRDILAENLRRLVTGKISNDQFEDRISWSNDPAIREIYLSAAWPLYDDLHEHKLTGKWKIGAENKTIIARCLLFLKTDQEYEWPRESGLMRLLWVILSLITFGVAGMTRSRTRDRLSGGEVGLWPFFRKSDYETALKQPPYLNCK